MVKFLEYILKENPVCKHCDSEINIEEHELYELYSDEIHYILCPFCDKELRVEVNCTYLYSTDNQDEE
jgi:hypothetical protein